MRNIFLVTHPEATHVVDNIIGGWFDSSLTEQGLENAARITAHLESRRSGDESLQLRTSDLQRTRQTAAIIGSAFGVEMILDPDLRERSYGVAEGTKPGSSPFLPLPPTGNRLDHFPGIMGTETRREWATRSYRAMDKLVSSVVDDLIVITHGGTLTYLVAAWIGLPLESAGYVKFKSTPGGVTHLRLDPVEHDRQVVSLNQTSHLV